MAQAPAGWVPPKPKLRLDTEAAPVPTLIVTRVTFTVDYNTLGSDGLPTVTSQEIVRRFKMKSFHAGSSAEKFAAAIIPKTEGLIPAKAEAAVVQTLVRLANKIKALGNTLEGGSPPASSPEAPTGPMAGSVGGLALQATPSSKSVSSKSSIAPTPMSPDIVMSPAPSSVTSQTASAPRARTRVAVAAPAVAAGTGDAAGAVGATPQRAPAASSGLVSASAPAAKPVAKPADAPPHTYDFTSFDYSTLPSPPQASAAAAGTLASLPQAFSLSDASIPPVTGLSGRPPHDAVPLQGDAAYIEHLDAYLEALYEDTNLERKVKATGFILQLMKNPKYLERLATNASLTAAMARVLTEERKHSMPLTLNLLECFWCISAVSQLHHVLTANKVGNTTLNALEYELRRRAHHVAEPPATPEERARREIYLARAERLCYMCVFILYNISEDLAIEMRVRQRRVQPMLLAILAQFENEDKTWLAPLKLLCALFLKKLTTMRINVVELLELNFLRLCPRFFQLHCPAPDAGFCSALLAVVYNMCFLRAARAAAALLITPLAVKALSHSGTSAAAAKFLYLLSTDPSLARSYARYLPSLPGPLVSYILNYPGPVSDPSACALLVNLSAAPALVPALLHGGALPALCRRLIATLDGGVLRCVRALSQHKAARSMLEPFAMPIAEIVLRGDRPDLRIEALGVLVNTPLNRDTCATLVTRYQLWDFLLQNIVPTEESDDVTLLMVQLVSTLAEDTRTAGLITAPKLITLLDENLAIALKESDTDCALHVLYALSRLLQHKRPRDVICRAPGAPALHDLIVTCTGWNDPLVKKYANLCIDFIVENPLTPLKEDLMTKRYSIHNADFVAFVKDGGLAELIAEFAADEQALAEGGEEEQEDPAEAWYAAYDEEEDDDEDEDDEEQKPAQKEGFSAFPGRSSKRHFLQRGL